jgi:hypothetical protein
MLFTSCSTGIGKATLDGSNIADSPVIIGWTKSDVSESYFSDIGTLHNTYPLSITGGNGGLTTADITVTLAVNTSSTATEGQEFNLPTKSFVIPAGSAFASIPIDVITGGFNSSSPTTVTVDISLSSNAAVVDGLSKQLNLTFVGCKSDVANFHYMVTLNGRGHTYGPYDETITEESVNSFLTYSVGYWDPPLNPGHGIRFSVICGVIHIQNQDLADMYSNSVKGVGTPTIDANGNFTLTYTIGLSGVDEIMVANYVRL